MKIGIVEIMPVGHYTLVDSIARIFLAGSENEIVIFTNSIGANVLNPLVKEMSGRINLITKKDEEKIDDFLKIIINYQLNKVYVVTLEKYFAELLHFKANCSIVLFIHNVDDWFRLNPLNLLYRFFKSFKYPGQIIYKTKVCFIYPFWKRRLVNKILNNGGKLAVLNGHIKQELSKYIETKKIEVIPFSVYNPDIKDESSNNMYIRICIPGMVDMVRRDYISVLKIFEEEKNLFKDQFELEFLGGIAYDVGGDKVVKMADKLIEKGLRIIYYDRKYIPLEEFDAKLSKANIILGNMNVIINKYSSYGKTKESGIAYTMIRASKPGILPADYPMLIELQSSTLIYNSYEELKSILLKLANNRSILKILTSEAQKNSLQFTPSNLLKNIE
jgi:hypothetical protein